MNITRETIKSALRNIMAEETEYQTFFKKALEKAGKSIPSMSDEEKKEFFNKIDTAWDGKGEKNEGNAFGAAVVAAKKAGEDEFEVGGKTYKVEESVNESQFKDLQIGDKFLRFGKNGQLWKKTSEKQAEFIKNVGKKTAKYNKKAGSLEVFPSTMDVSFYVQESVNESHDCGCGCGGVTEAIAVGKMVKVVDNPHWEAALGKKGPFKRKVKGIYGDSVFFTDGSNSDMKYVKESVTEGVSPKDMESIKSAVQSASSFMNIGSELKKLGMKYIFATSPMPIYVVQDKGGNRVGIVNKKYATKPDFVHGDTAVGVMENIQPTNEGIGTIALGVAGGLLLLKVLKFVLKKAFRSIGMNVKLPKEKLLEIVKQTIATTLTKASGGGINIMEIVALQSYLKDEINAGRITTIKQIVQVVDKVSKKDKNESITEGRAFINAARKAKAEGKTEFEFNGKTYPVTIKESINEGKKRFNTQYNVGKSKYVVNYHDGKKKHKDGSDFFDVKIFKNKPELEAFKKDLVSKGFVAESVVNEDRAMNVKVKQLLDKGLSDLTKGKPNHQFAVMHVLMGALTDANFHSEAKKVPSIFARAKYEGDPRGKQDAIGIYEEMGEKVASICKWDGKDIVDAIGFYVSMTIGRPVGEKVEKLVESINETISLLNTKK